MSEKFELLISAVNGALMFCGLALGTTDEEIRSMSIARAKCALDLVENCMIQADLTECERLEVKALVDSAKRRLRDLGERI